MIKYNYLVTINYSWYQLCRTQLGVQFRRCNCCGTKTRFVEYGTVCRRYCFKRYRVQNPDDKNKTKIAIPANCTLQKDYDITEQDANDNLFPLRPSLVPVTNITCIIEEYVLAHTRVLYVVWILAVFFFACHSWSQWSPK